MVFDQRGQNVGSQVNVQPHEHHYVFLRERIDDNPRQTVRYDVFFCEGCLDRKEVETWRSRYSL